MKTEVDYLMLAHRHSGVNIHHGWRGFEADACRKGMMARHEWTKTWSHLGGTSFRE